jgi:hypothetical protein
MNGSGKYEIVGMNGSRKYESKIVGAVRGWYEWG